MKSKSFKALAIGVVAVMALGCNPLGKMAKNSPTIKYKLQPDPLEMHGDSVAINVSGSFPPKYFHKKAVVTITPSMKDLSGNKVKDFESITLIGNMAEGEGKKIDFVGGGSFNMSVKLPYEAAMADVSLEIDATASYKSKTKEFEGIPIGEGTIITPLRVQKDARPILGSDNFKKVIPRSVNAEINFLVNSANVRSGEIREDDVKALEAFVADGVEKEFVFMGVSTEAYASPDGEISLNENLANDRAANASKAVKKMLTKAKVDAAKEDGFYSNVGKGEDWNGFKSLMQKSEIKDKDLILRILGMYTDLDRREKEIKNLAATYTEVANDILPQLRRATITLKAEERAKTNDELKALVKSNPDTLNIEEILYTATLYPNNLDEQLSIYRTAARVHKTDWRGSNNAGYVLVLQNKVDDAKSEFEKAGAIDNSNAIVKNNLGLVALMNDNRSKARSLFDQATSAGSDVNYNMGILDIKDGNYGDAVSNMGSNSTLNAALAKMLNGDNAGALSTIDRSEAKNTASAHYLKAILGARQSNKDLMISNLKAAVSKDGAIKNIAKMDVEFLKYRNDGEFKSAVE